MNNVKRFYMTVFSISCSPRPGYVAAGNSYGVICLFDVTKQFSNMKIFNEFELQMKYTRFPDEMEESKESGYTQCTDEILNTSKEVIEPTFEWPIFKFVAHATAVSALVSTSDLLISGSIGELCAWKWEDILSGVAKCVICIALPRRSNLQPPEVNALGVSSIDNTIVYVGCGNNKIYSCDIVTGKILLTFSGHSDMIYCLKVLKDSRQFLSGSGDGSLRLWDPVKGNEAVSVVEPYKHEKLNRQRCGKRVACVDCDDKNEWMVCGGGPSLGLWDLRSLLPSTVFKKPASQFYVARFHNDYILSGGSENLISHWDFNGDLKAEVPTAATCIFDLQISPAPYQLLFACGSSYKMDAFKDFRVKSFSLCNDL